MSIGETSFGFPPGAGAGATAAAAASRNVRLVLVEPATELLDNMAVFICTQRTPWSHVACSGGQQRRLDVLETPD